MTDSKEVHTLAEKLYDASNTTDIPWNRRGRLIHDVWLVAATRQLAVPNDGDDHEAVADADAPVRGK